MNKRITRFFCYAYRYIYGSSICRYLYFGIEQCHDFPYSCYLSIHIVTNGRNRFDSKIKKYSKQLLIYMTKIKKKC